MKTTRLYRFISLCACLALHISSLCSSYAQASSPPPNFVIIILDDWGWHQSGAYGDQVIQTPHIDDLAARGMQFDNAFLTASTCSPSRASILTGLHPVASGVPKLHQAIPADRKLISHYLREAGYFTVSAGKWHIGWEVKDQFNQVVLEQDSIDQSHSGAEDWAKTIEDLPSEQPFFLWLAAKDPHRPWTYDQRWAKHNPEDMVIPPYILTKKSYSEADVRQDLAKYYDEISRADHYVGEVTAALTKRGQLDNTLIIVMSDNGPPFWKAKKFLTDPGLRTPLIVHWPEQIKQHTKNPELLSSIDIAPTLISLAGATIPDHLEGHSFAHWLNSQQENYEPIRQFVYGEKGDPALGSANGRSIRDRQFLYIQNDYGAPWVCMPETRLIERYGEQFFDVTADPHSLDNLVLNKEWLAANSETLDRYRALMLQRRQQRDDLPKPIPTDACDLLEAESSSQLSFTEKLKGWIRYLF